MIQSLKAVMSQLYHAHASQSFTFAFLILLHKSLHRSCLFNTYTNFLVNLNFPQQAFLCCLEAFNCSRMRSTLLTRLILITNLLKIRFLSLYFLLPHKYKQDPYSCNTYNFPNLSIFSSQLFSFQYLRASL